jgi:hypothetical protein
VSDLSIQATKQKENGTTYWRSEFERIYVISANKSRIETSQATSGVFSLGSRPTSSNAKLDLSRPTPCQSRLDV